MKNECSDDESFVLSLDAYLSADIVIIAYPSIFLSAIVPAPLATTQIKPNKFRRLPRHSLICVRADASCSINQLISHHLCRLTIYTSHNPLALPAMWNTGARAPPYCYNYLFRLSSVWAICLRIIIYRVWRRQYVWFPVHLCPVHSRLQIHFQLACMRTTT